MNTASDRERASAAEDAAWRKLLAHLAECPEKLTGKKLVDRECAECHRLHRAHRATLAAFAEYHGDEQPGILRGVSFGGTA